MLDYDFGPAFDYNDLSGVIARQPPRDQAHPPHARARASIADGNEIVGRRVAAAPGAARHLSRVEPHRRRASSKGRSADSPGGYVPFALTRAEREKTGDPRRSIEERYGTQEGYACAVRRAAEALVARSVPAARRRRPADRRGGEGPDPAGERREHGRGAPDRRRFVPMSEQVAGRLSAPPRIPPRR